MDKFYLTNYKVYTKKEINKLWSNAIKPKNLKILKDHLAYGELAESILSFVEIEGVLHFNLGNGEGLLKVERRK